MTIRILARISRGFLQCNGATTILPTHSRQINIRYLMTEPPKQQTKKALKQEREKFRTYVIQRYMQYVKNYRKVFELRFPTAMKMYRVFTIGLKDFFKDLKTYISLRIKVAGDKSFSTMSRQEIELYQKMPSDMLRIAPVLILSAIPFGNYLIFPLAYLKPRTLLCSHFWSIQQRSEFSVLELKDRLKHNRSVFRALQVHHYIFDTGLLGIHQAKLDAIPDGTLKKKWSRVIAQLGSGVHPTAHDVLACKELFTHGPYELTNLTYRHRGYLIKIHGLRKSIIFRTNKLKYRAFLLLEMDKAIVKEGGADSLSTDALRNACHIRGLNSTHLSNHDMITWLQQWLKVSLQLDKTSYSLILHCPIFFAYNHPQNWVLIY